MKRVNNLYDKICNIENIQLAHKNARKGKTSYREVMQVDEDVDRYCLEISEILKQQLFKNSPYKSFLKLDKGKERTIHKLPYFPDRIIHHAIMQVLEPVWKPILIADTFQSIPGRGVHKAKSRIEATIRKADVNYCLKLDIRKFYPSVDNRIMKDIVRKKIKCIPTLKLLDEIIDSIPGLPIGNYLSQYLGNLYLSYLDHYTKEVLMVKYYYRYCDDVVILSKTKEQLHEALGNIKEYLDKMLKLSLKHNYQVFPITRGVDFLGFRFFRGYTLLRKSIATNLKRSAGSFLRRPTISNFASLVSYYGWVKASDGRNLWGSIITPRLLLRAKALGITNKIIRGIK